MNENESHEMNEAPNDATTPQPVAIPIPDAPTAVPRANKRDHGAITEIIRRELQSRFSDSLSMEQIDDCSDAIAEKVGSPPNNRRIARESRSAVRGVIERSPHSGIWWISYIDAERKRHREK